MNTPHRLRRRPGDGLPVVRSENRRSARAIGAAILAGACAGLGACAEPLLSPDEPRSPFDRYDRLRSQYAAQYTFDEFGRRVSNLRARLMPKE